MDVGEKLKTQSAPNNSTKIAATSTMTSAARKTTFGLHILGEGSVGSESAILNTKIA
jgi:hypothetical protein